MIKLSRLALAATLALALSLSPFLSFAASIPLLTGPLEPSQMQGTLNGLINTINSSVTAQSMADFSGFRNYLDNGAMAVQQRGTSAQTGGTTSGCTVGAYVADRWCVDTNVTSGAGKGQVITSTPTPPQGFSASMSVWRNSGALLQPVCVVQEIPTVDSTQLAGQQVVFSFYAQALAGLVADNGGVINAYILYGTGSDQGLGTMTASPAITPAWTGINSSITGTGTLATSWSRYSITGILPTTVTEAGVAICFTPTATGAGATDGFAFTGAQLEQGGAASAFEFRPYGVELAKGQRYYVQWADSLAATFTLPGVCTETTANTTAACVLNLPVTMRAAPTAVVATATSFGMTKAADGTAEGCTTLAVVASANNPNSVKLTCAVSETAAVGTAHLMLYANTGAANTLTVSSDF